jgi:glycosyltransferase involved in cell wall biosynthesis
MISILILTKNEQHDLPGCLDSVAWSDDIHVFDSGSTDGTEIIATRAGAKFSIRDSTQGRGIFGGNEAEHKNWALKNLNFRYPWVLHLDADERVTPELAANIRQAIRNPHDKVAFRIRRRDFWGGSWLKHVQASSYYLRLFRPEKMRYERLVNPVSVPLGPVGDVDGFLDHYPFSKGMTHWLARHNSYSSLEAEQILKNRGTNQSFSLFQALFAKDVNTRRFHQKEFFYRVPARPLLKFALLYVGKRGFLDGSAGFRYAVLQSIYEYMIVLKTKELAQQSPAVAAVPNESKAIPQAVLKENYANSRTRD